MKWTRKEIKTQARANYKKNVLYGIVVCVIMQLLNGNYTGITALFRMPDLSLSQLLSPEVLAGLVIGGIGMSVAFFFLRIVIGNIVGVGAARYFLRNRTEKQVGLDSLTFGFKEGRWGNLALAMLLRELTVFLWSLLLIVPGIVKSYEYILVPYLLADHPGMDRKQAMELSRKMMEGEKGKMFALHLSFLPWMLLCVLTLGLGYLFLNPYIEASTAEVYAALREDALKKGWMTKEETIR